MIANLFSTAAASASPRLAVCPEVHLLHEHWSAEIYHEWFFPESVLGFWQEAAKNLGDRGLFVRPEWLRCWSQAFVAPGQLYIVALRQYGKIRAIVALSQERDEGGWLLQNLGAESFFQILTLDEEYTAVVEALLALFRKVNLRVCLERTASACGLAAVIEERARLAGVPYWRMEEDRAPYVDLSSQSWQEYEQKVLSTRVQRSIKQGISRAQKDGQLEYEVLTLPAAVNAVMDRLFEIEGSGWKRAGGEAILGSQAKQTWYRSIFLWGAQAGILRLFLLKFNGIISAFNATFVSGSTLFGVKTGYDMEMARYSFGNLSRYHLLRSLAEDSTVKKYDFNGHLYAYEREWTNSYATGVTLMLYPPTPQGKLQYFLKHGWKTYLKRSSKLVELNEAWRARRRKHS